jgi:hypothetical protein
MGDPNLGYTGQADKFWIVCNKEKTQLGIVITDWKTNKPKNFVETKWTTECINLMRTYQILH